MLRPSDLLVPYSKWREINPEELTNEEREWYREWESHDLSVSPMSDEERKLIRYGHYLGWFAAKNKKQ
ncbi:hypothetical protein H839_15983 [Parageobacillus genomosp. 1]|uniref:Uncharacterized protein n=2 Tax=Parageobacillus genomosp. 1 TaxID=1295642 RepID=A0ABC9VA53_9BACL|nr:hypothetical protein H839_15983 [Parageobacillus genomosp. 1]